MTHKQQHGGWAAQAKRRGESYLFCNKCGKVHPRAFQATPVQPKRRMTGLDWTLAIVGAIYFFVLAFVVRGWAW